MRPSTLEAFVQSLEPDLRQAFIAAIHDLQGQLPVGTLIDALRRRDVDAVEAILRDLALGHEAAAAIIRQAYLAGASHALGGLRVTQARVLGLLQRSNPFAVRAAEHTATRITNISGETRAAIRSLVGQSLEDGVSPRDTARLIRGVIGLDERSIRAVVRYEAALVDDGAQTAHATLLAERYAGQLLRQRSLTIARTEIQTAAHLGQQSLWAHAVQAGVLGSESLKVWIASDDACDECADLNEVRVPVADPFDSEDGPVMTPPLHPRCRCGMGLAFESLARRSA